MRTRHTLLLLSLPLLASNSVHAIDDNSNGLSDVWEQRFNASALEILGDDDGDGFSNVEECIAGTDPMDSTSRPAIYPLVNQDDPNQIRLSFQSVLGKQYLVSQSLDLDAFDSLPPAWLGDNAERILEIDKDGLATTTSPIKADFWGNIDPSAIEYLYNHSEFPGSPHGSSFLNSPQAPDFLATGYGARITFWISPTQSGLHTFFLSAGGPAELSFGETAARDELSTITASFPVPHTAPASSIAPRHRISSPRVTAPASPSGSAQRKAGSILSFLVQADQLSSPLEKRPRVMN